MKYLEYVNQKINSVLSEAPPMIVFGQNINAGSCISGYTRGLKLRSGGMVINSINSENTLTGVGFGAMMTGMNAIFFMKQLDFLLLGIDQIVNTNNILRTNPARGSFSIMPIIVDSGWDGPQSSLNTLPDFCSIASVDGYSVTNQHDIDYIFENFMIKPGFRLICSSQRLLKTDLISFPHRNVRHSANGTWFHYQTGKNLTIACFNMSLPQGKKLSDELLEMSVSSSLFSLNHVHQGDWSEVLKDAHRTGRLLILDDTKSNNSPSHRLGMQAMRVINPKNVLLMKRPFSTDWFKPSNDQFNVSTETILQWTKGETDAIASHEI